MTSSKIRASGPHRLIEQLLQSRADMLCRFARGVRKSLIGRFRRRRTHPLEQAKQRRRQEARELGRTVRIPRGMIAVVVFERKRHIQHIAGTRHGHIEKPAFFFQLLLALHHVRWEHAVRGMDDVDHVPFTALGRMDGRQDHVFLVEMRRAREVSRGSRRVERQVGQERGSAVRLLGKQLKLIEIAQSYFRVVVTLLEQRAVVFAHEVDLGRQGERLALRRPAGSGGLTGS